MNIVSFMHGNYLEEKYWTSILTAEQIKLKDLVFLQGILDLEKSLKTKRSEERD